MSFFYAFEWSYGFNAFFGSVPAVRLLAFTSMRERDAWVSSGPDGRSVWGYRTAEDLTSAQRLGEHKVRCAQSEAGSRASHN